MRFRLATILALSAVSACTDDPHPAAPPVAPESGSVAFVLVSDLDARVGDTVTVTVSVRSAQDVARVGAFTSTLAFDDAGLAYLGPVALGGGMRAVNAKGGELTAAGASAEGFADGRLFAVTFQVANPAALRSFALEMKELGSVDFGDHLGTLDVRRAVFAEPRLR